MALATDIITTARLREAIGEVGDESDALLMSMRDSAISWIEEYTGRCIVDRDGYVSDDSDFYRCWDDADWVEWKVSDVKAGSLTIRYEPAGNDPVGQATGTPLVIATTDARVKRTQDSVKIFSARNAPWHGVMRMIHPTPILVADRGMDASDIPAAWSDACALMVRALYDGSAYDELGNMSPLKYLLHPYMRGAYMRSART